VVVFSAISTENPPGGFQFAGNTKLSTVTQKTALLDLNKSRSLRLSLLWMLFTCFRGEGKRLGVAFLGEDLGAIMVCVCCV